MKKLVLLFAGLVWICGLLHADSQPSKQRVITTLFPLYDFAREVGKEKVDVNLLLPPGVEAHSFSPTPKDIVDIHKAAVFIYTGNAMEPWVEDMLKGHQNKDLLVIDASKTLDESEHCEGGCDHDHGHHEHGEESHMDPHIWLDPVIAKKIVQAIAAGLEKKDPKNKEFYQKNADAYCKKLDDLDKRIKETLKHCQKKTIMYGGHFAFGYFTKRYGLKHVSPYQGFSPNAQPSPKSIIKLIKAVKKDNVKAVYFEELIEPKVARIIKEETGAKLLLLHGAHNVTKKEKADGATYLSIMNGNLDRLKEGLEYKP